MGTIYLAGGCFWGLQKFFDQFGGVIRTEVGYANGPDKAPSYQEVCRNSGHAETVLVEYDDKEMDLEALLDYYFMVIDPLSVNRQGNDIGIQYRTGIYYTDEAQLPIIRKVYERQQEEIGKPLAVEVSPIRNFFSAEEYHQKYLDYSEIILFPGRQELIKESFRNLPTDPLRHEKTGFTKDVKPVSKITCASALC